MTSSQNGGACAGRPEVPRGDELLCIFTHVINKQVALGGQDPDFQKVCQDILRSMAIKEIHSQIYLSVSQDVRKIIHFSTCNFQLSISHWKKTETITNSRMSWHN